MSRFAGPIVALGSLLLSLVLVEGLLRAQQAIGPIYDLEFNTLGSLPSETLNHVHAPREDWILADRDRYGDHWGHRYTVRYDAFGVRLDAGRVHADPNAMDILVLGDSFVEGYDDENTLTHFMREELDERGVAARLLNAGASSYSPLIFTVQAKALVPQFRPDLVVVVIDETDLGDDVLRYRQHTERDAQGRVARIRSSPAHRDFVGGFLSIKESEHALYLTRMARRLYHAKFRGRTTASRREMAAVDPLLYSRDVEPDAAERHREAIRFFESSVDELLRTLVELMGDADKVLVVRHPHLQHLVAAADGRVWNRFVAETLERVTAQRAVAYYDAEADLRRAFGSRPHDYYWPNDMHFNFKGLREYGRLLAARIG